MRWFLPVVCAAVGGVIDGWPGALDWPGALVGLTVGYIVAVLIGKTPSAVVPPNSPEPKKQLSRRVEPSPRVSSEKFTVERLHEIMRQIESSQSSENQSVQAMSRVNAPLSFGANEIPPPPPPGSRAQSKLTWYARCQPVIHAGLLVDDGMVYASERALPWPGEPSAIITSLSVARTAAHPLVDFGYYPSYDRISAEQRRCYLEWLSAGRKDDDPAQRSLGYVFMFFYGLERRIVLDHDREPALLEEVLRLLQHYGSAHKSRSLKSVRRGARSGRTRRERHNIVFRAYGTWSDRCRHSTALSDRVQSIFCNSRRQTELLADKLRGLCEHEHWPRNPFLLHHGSLSRELREDAERELKSGEPVTAICTSTLEMGIDLGAVRAIGQVGPTWSVASLVQRLGRSGRREGEPQILRLYTLDEAITERSSLSDRLFPELIRAVALLELHGERWLEPPEHDRFHFSTCVHQVLSVLRQTGGASAMHLQDVLCHRGAFHRIEQAQLASLLRGLAASELIEQIPTGELILAPAGERVVESRDFYAAFASRIEYRIEHDGQPIGVLPQDSIPAEGEFLLLAGRRWRVNLVDHSSKRVSVVPAKGWKQPRFAGGIGGLHPAITQRMKRVLSEETGYPFLNIPATQLLAEARRNFANAGLDLQDTVTSLRGVEWFPWRGSRVLITLELCAKADGLKTERDDLSIRYQKLAAADFAVHCGRIMSGAFTAEQLVMLVADLQRDRFDEHVPEALLQEAFVAEALDLPGAQKAAETAQIRVGPN